ASGVDDELALLAVDLGVDDRVLGNLVEVIGVLRRVLEAPFDLAVIWADGEDAGGPFVVAWPGFDIVIRAFRRLGKTCRVPGRKSRSPRWSRRHASSGPFHPSRSRCRARRCPG